MRGGSLDRQKIKDEGGVEAKLLQQLETAEAALHEAQELVDNWQLLWSGRLLCSRRADNNDAIKSAGRSYEAISKINARIITLNKKVAQAIESMGEAWEVTAL